MLDRGHVDEVAGERSALSEYGLSEEACDTLVRARELIASITRQGPDIKSLRIPQRTLQYLRIWPMAASWLDMELSSQYQKAGIGFCNARANVAIMAHVYRGGRSRVSTNVWPDMEYVLRTHVRELALLPDPHLPQAKPNLGTNFTKAVGTTRPRTGTKRTTLRSRWMSLPHDPCLVTGIEPTETTGSNFTKLLENHCDKFWDSTSDTELEFNYLMFASNCSTLSGHVDWPRGAKLHTSPDTPHKDVHAVQAMLDEADRFLTNGLGKRPYQLAKFSDYLNTHIENYGKQMLTSALSNVGRARNEMKQAL